MDQPQRERQAKDCKRHRRPYDPLVAVVQQLLLFVRAVRDVADGYFNVPAPGS